MKMIKLTIRWVLLIAFTTLVLQACVAGKRLETRPADPADPKGTCTLLLYGCHYADDNKNLALLVDEGSRYPLEIYDIPTSYKVIPGVPAPKALSEAEDFVRCSFRHVSRTELHRIVDDMGGTIGYEVRPIYAPWEFGWPDILLVSYLLQNGIVRTYISLDPDVERALQFPKGPGE